MLHRLNGTRFLQEVQIEFDINADIKQIEKKLISLIFFAAARGVSVRPTATAAGTGDDIFLRLLFLMLPLFTKSNSAAQTVPAAKSIAAAVNSIFFFIASFNKFSICQPQTALVINAGQTK